MAKFVRDMTAEYNTTINIRIKKNIIFLLLIKFANNMRYRSWCLALLLAILISDVQVDAQEIEKPEKMQVSALKLAANRNDETNTVKGAQLASNMRKREIFNHQFNKAAHDPRNRRRKYLNRLSRRRNMKRILRNPIKETNIEITNKREIHARNLQGTNETHHLSTDVLEIKTADGETYFQLMNVKNCSCSNITASNLSSQTSSTSTLFADPMGDTQFLVVLADSMDGNQFLGQFADPMPDTQDPSQVASPINGSEATDQFANPMNGSHSPSQVANTITETEDTNQVVSPMNGTDTTSQVASPINGTEAFNQFVNPINGSQTPKQIENTFNGTKDTNQVANSLNGTEATNKVANPINGTAPTNQVANPINGTVDTNQSASPMNGTEATNQSTNIMNGTKDFKRVENSTIGTQPLNHVADPMNETQDPKEIKCINRCIEYKFFVKPYCPNPRLEPSFYECSTVFLAKPDDDCMFLVCVLDPTCNNGNGTSTVPMQCPAGTYFDTKSKRCDHKCFADRKLNCPTTPKPPRCF